MRHLAGTAPRFRRVAALRALIAILAVVLMVPTNAPTASATSSKYLSISHLQQNQSQWCWNTAARVVILWHKGSAVNQCQLHRDGKQASTCPNTPGTTAEIKRAVGTYLSTSGTWSGGALTASQLTTQINLNQPIISAWAWKTSGGHAVTVYGYCAGCNGTTYVNASNIDAVVGTSTSAATKKAYPLETYVNNSSFSNFDNLLGAK